MNIKTLCLTGALLLTGISIYAQKKKEVINDSNTPLHLLQPAYKVPYKELTTTEIKTDIDRILRYRLMHSWNEALSALPVMNGELRTLP